MGLINFTLSMSLFTLSGGSACNESAFNTHDGHGVFVCVYGWEGCVEAISEVSDVKVH